MLLCAATFISLNPNLGSKLYLEPLVARENRLK